MTPTKNLRAFENTHVHTVRSTVTEREAREGILRDIVGEWNERSPLVYYYNSTCFYSLLNLPPEMFFCGSQKSCSNVGFIESTTMLKVCV